MLLDKYLQCQIRMIQRQCSSFLALLSVSLIVMKILYSAMFAVWIAVFPLAYLYVVQKCPSDESFDAKKELKRVLRG